MIFLASRVKTFKVLDRIKKIIYILFFNTNFILSQWFIFLLELYLLIQSMIEETIDSIYL